MENVSERSDKVDKVMNALEQLEQLIKAYKEANTLPLGIPGKSPRHEEQAYQLERIRNHAREHGIPKDVIIDMVG